MKDENRTEVYFGSLLSDNDKLGILRQSAEEENIPIIRRSTEHYLRWLCATIRPKSILEIGTAVGYSAMRLLSFSDDDAVLTTIEISEKSARIAKENFIRFGYGDRIELITGDGCEVLPKLSCEYDIILLDAAKGQYMGMLSDCKRLLRVGGVLVSDNILQDGDTLESRYTIRRRDRTIHTRMREFLYAISHDDTLVTDFISDGDGIAVSTKIKAYEKA